MRLIIDGKITQIQLLKRNPGDHKLQRFNIIENGQPVAQHRLPASWLNDTLDGRGIKANGQEYWHVKGE